MMLWKRAFLLGLLSWAIPFAVSLVVGEAAAKYYSEIGVDYLVFPVFALAASKLATKEAKA